MRPGLRQAMADLHRWAGLGPGWLLFAVFLTGSLSYFRPEISMWTRPEIRAAEVVDQTAALRSAQAFLERNAEGASRWLIELPTPRLPLTQVMVWQPGGPGPHYRHELLDPRAGTVVQARPTFGGDFFFYFHFDLHMPWRLGRFLVGFAAMAMLVALLTGIVVHRRLFADFFTFRPHKGPRSWLDAHNVFGVLALPYHLMIAYSGLVILMMLYLPWGADRLFAAQPALFLAEAGQSIVPPPDPGPAAGQSDLAPLLTEADRHWPGEAPGRVDVYWPGRAASRIVVTLGDDQRLTHAGERLVFDGAGAPLPAEPGQVRSAPARLERVLYGLHLGRFGGWPVRVLFFFSGLAGAAMVGTGLILWTAKGHAGRLAETLNLAVIGGLPIAVATFFWANRLLPTGLAGRAILEGGCFFAGWSLAAVHAVLRRDAVAWRTQFAGVATLFITLALLDGVLTGRGLSSGDRLFAGFDLAFLAAGCGFALLARLCRARRGGA